MSDAIIRVGDGRGFVVMQQRYLGGVERVIITAAHCLPHHPARGVEEETYRAYRVLIHGIFVLLVVFAFFGNHIVWSQCLSGIAWRTWLLLYALPAWIALYRERA